MHVIIAAALAAMLAGAYSLTLHLNIYSKFLVLAIALLLLAGISLRRLIGHQPEYGFLAVALICGSLLSISAPNDYNSWDEQIHYRRAELIASHIAPSMYVRPGKIPFSYSLQQQENNNALVSSSYRPRRKHLDLNLSYASIGYFPSAIALALGSKTHVPYWIVYIFGRWINVVLFSFVVFFGIRKLKSGKMIMSVVALFPTSIYLASCYNYDSWVTAFSMLGMGYLFSEIQQPEKTITISEASILIGAFVIGFGPKAIYFPLMFLLLFIKPDKFKCYKYYVRFRLATTLSIALVISSFLVPLVLSGFGSGDPRGGAAVNSTEQVNFILSEPVAYAKVLFRFVYNYINPLHAPGYVTFFAFQGRVAGFWLVCITLAFTVLTDNINYGSSTANWKIKASVVGVCLSTVALIATAIYISFNPVRSPGIAGVQPRYLIPLVFPIVYIIGSKRIKLTINKSIYNSVAFAIMAVVLMRGIWDLMISRYY